MAALAFDRKTGLNVPQVAVWMVFLVMFLDTIGATISTPALPYYAQAFGCTNAQIGYLFGAWSLTSTLFAPVLGTFADRWGRRTVLLLSLVGAGTAAIMQGAAVNYWMLLGARAFSGIWAAVGSTAQVYLADCCSPEMLPTYMSRLSAVPGMAMIVGPGLGGGLAKFGLQVPILVDGVVSLFSSVLVFLYLPESAAWLEEQKAKKADKEASELTPLQTPKTSNEPDDVEEQQSQEKPKVAKSWTLTWLCLAQLFNGITFSTLVSMLAIALKAKVNFDALEVGYTFVGMALVMVFTSIWFTPWYTTKFGVANAAFIGTMITAIANVGFAFSTTVPKVFLALSFARIAQSLRGATFGTLVARTTNIQNRGATLARVQVFLNCGRLIGPVLGGHLANDDPLRAPWLVAGAASFISAAFLALALAFHARGDFGGLIADEKAKFQSRPSLPRGFTTLKGTTAVLTDEAPSPDDVHDLGEWFADLLTTRHYQWVSKKDAIRSLISNLLPELHETSCDHVDDLERLMKHANLMASDFNHHADHNLHHRG